jgi:hypothetical protein
MNLEFQWGRGGGGIKNKASLKIANISSLKIVKHIHVGPIKLPNLGTT